MHFEMFTLSALLKYEAETVAYRNASGLACGRLRCLRSQTKAINDVYMAIDFQYLRKTAECEKINL